MFRSPLEQEVAAATAVVAAIARRVDPDEVPAHEAVRLYRALDGAARALTAAKTLLARRVEDSREWRRLGFASAAEFLAAESGTSLGAARKEVETSDALRQLPATKAALLDGSLSAAQGEVIAGAATANPGAEEQLIATAATANLNALRDAALKAKTAADPCPEATHRRIRQQRRLRRFTDAEGARHWHLVGPVDELAAWEADLDRETDRIFRERSTADRLHQEPREAYAFDALIAIGRRSRHADIGVGSHADTATARDVDAATSPAVGPGASDSPGATPDELGGPEPAAQSGADARGTSRPKQPRPEHLALLRLDVEALWRGHVEGDELCEITGLGPIPVAVARRLLGDAVLKLLITKGDAVAHVTSLTRGPTQAMRYALLWTSPTCTVEGCTRTIVEHDHRWGAEYATTRHTRLDELDDVCHGHHDLHTRAGWALVPGTGKRPMVPPDDPRHPAHSPPERAPAEWASPRAAQPSAGSQIDLFAPPEPVPQRR
jgi:hypothetical protein